MTWKPPMPPAKPPAINVKFNKKLTSTVTENFTKNTNVYINKDVYVKEYVTSDADIKDNVAILDVAVEAVGKNTLAQISGAVLTVEGELSSINALVIAASDNGY